MRFLVTVLILALAAVFIPSAIADNYAVLISGSNGFWNYRHHADVAHSYQILKANGFDDDHIITMVYGDVPTAPSNPYPNKLYNKPTNAGEEPVDVWNGVKVDYSGASCTGDNFINVITGNSTQTGGRPVLKTTKDDNVFIYFSDHGTVGGIQFPDGRLLSVQALQKGLTYMYQQSMYNKLVFYLEACESGSMFEGWLGDNMRIFATTAANGKESSWGWYCPPGDLVRGKSLGSCLGDEYSITWLEDTDTYGTDGTVYDQSVRVQQKVSKSHVQFFGDINLAKNSKLSEFLNAPGKESTKAKGFKPAPVPVDHNMVAIDSRNIKFEYLLNQYKNDMTIENGIQLLGELKTRLSADIRFNALSQAFGSNSELLTKDPENVGTCGECCEIVHRAIEKHNGYNEYSLKYGRFAYNVCASTNKVSDVVKKIDAIFTSPLKF